MTNKVTGYLILSEELEFDNESLGDAMFNRTLPTELDIESFVDLSGCDREDVRVYEIGRQGTIKHAVTVVFGEK